MNFEPHLIRDGTTITKDVALAYAVRARLDGSTGPEATVTDLNLGVSHLVQADNRAILLYLLARQHAQHALSGTPIADDDRGWCSNEEVMLGIWGRSQSRENTLHVLVHRLRAELQQAGLNPSFIEKRRGFVRARLVRSELE